MQVLFYAIHFIAFIDKKQDIFSSFSQTNRRHTFAVGLFHSIWKKIKQNQFQTLQK